MDPEIADGNLWNEAKVSNFDEGPITWFFLPNDPTSIRIQGREEVQIEVTHRILLELAIFDIMATFWESVLQVPNSATANLSLYHVYLCRLVTSELLGCSKIMKRILETPSSLRS